MSDPEEIAGLEGLVGEHQNLLEGPATLVKVKIQKAEYYETRSTHKAPWWQTAWTSMAAWFRHDAYRSGDMFFPAS